MGGAPPLSPRYGACLLLGHAALPFAVRNQPAPGLFALCRVADPKEGSMDSIIYLVGLVVVILAILSFLGLR